MRPSACAAISVVTELVNVHAAIGRGIVAADVIGNGCWGGLRRLLEGDGTANLGVTAEDCDCVERMMVSRDLRRSGLSGKREGETWDVAE